VVSPLRERKPTRRVAQNALWRVPNLISAREEAREPETCPWELSPNSTQKRAKRVSDGLCGVKKEERRDQ